MTTLTKPKKPRQYPVPKIVEEALQTKMMTLDEMELVAACGIGPASEWAERVLAKENKKLVDQILDGGSDLPFGLIDGSNSGNDDPIVSALAVGDNVWDKSGWKCKTHKDECGVCSGKNAKAQLLNPDDDYFEQDVDYPDFLEGLDQSLQITLSPDLADAVAPAELEQLDAQVEGVCPTCGSHLATGRQTLELTMDEVASVIRALQEGAEAVMFKPYAPLAHMDVPLVSAMTAEDTGLPEGSVVVAVVDENDPNAVLELLAVSPGPIVSIRENKTWAPSDEWRTTMTGSTPPPVVSLEDPELIESVVTQVDAYDPEAQREADEAAEAAAEENEQAEEDLDAVAASSSYVHDVLEQICRENQEAQLLAVITAAPSPIRKAANKAAGAERLRQYWGYGEGALKIRWGTKGDWRRCVRQLTKYLGPRAKGYCNLMHARVTGTWPNSKGAGKLPNPAVKAEAIAKQLSR